MTISENASNAVNQQGSLRDPSETTRRAPFSKASIKSYILGSLHDGTFSSNRRYRISQKGTDWLEMLKNLFSQLGYNSWIYKEGKDRDVYVLETLADFLDFNFDPLLLKTKREKICYIKGFFDAEGGIPRNKNDRFYIQLMQSDKDKIEKLKTILSSLGIMTGKIHNPSYRRDPNHWRLYILANSHKEFVKKIGS